METKRRQYLDIIRILAIFLVIFNHQQGYLLFRYAEGAMQSVYMVITMLTRINVPLFFMISGSLLLGRCEDFKTVLKKRVSRFAAVIVLFVTCMYIAYYLMSLILDKEFDFTLSRLLYGLIGGGLPGTSSYWFLYAYTAFLLMLPFLQRIAKGMNRQDFTVLLCLHFFFSSLLPIINLILEAAGFKEAIVYHYLAAPLATVKAFFYPLIGYYLDNRIDISKITPKKLLAPTVAAAAGILISCLCTYHEGVSTGSFTESYVQLFDYVTAIATFLWIKYLFTQRPRLARLLERPRLSAAVVSISSLTFGMYILDPFLKKALFSTVFEKITEPFLPTIIVSVLWCLFSMTVCGCLTLLLKKLPVFRKIL